MASRTGILIQARSNSSRLPGKIYCGIPLAAGPAQLEHIYWRLSGVEADVLAVLVPETDTFLADWCRARGMDVLTGPEDDVRERYRSAARKWDLDLIVRATGDNPCVDPAVARDTLQKLEETGADLFSFPNLPLGVAVEAFTSQALLADGPRYSHATHREHVSLHIKHNPEDFVVLHEPHPIMEDFPQIGEALPRLTVDTSTDLSVVRSVFSVLGQDFDLRTVLELFLKRPELFSANQNVAQRVFAMQG